MSKYNGLYKTKNGKMLVSKDLSLEALKKICDEKFRIIIMVNDDKANDYDPELIFYIDGDKK